MELILQNCKLKWNSCSTISLENVPQECNGGIAKNISSYIASVYVWSVHAHLSLELFVLWSWDSSASSLMLIVVYLWAAIFSSLNFVSLVKLVMHSSWNTLLSLAFSSLAILSPTAHSRLNVFILNVRTSTLHILAECSFFNHWVNLRLTWLHLYSINVSFCYVYLSLKLGQTF